MTNTPDVQMYEDMFAHRFTADDKEYQDYLKRPQDVPPVVEDWKMSNQRYHDRPRDNRHHREGEGRRDWSSNSYNQPQRGRGWGNNYNPYRQESRYGHNHGNQRFQSDRY
ncbi:RNA guanine-N7 methyltransferase activating subunit [Pelodytes ibericus]